MNVTGIEVVMLDVAEIEVHDVNYYQWNQVQECEEDSLSKLIIDGTVAPEIMEVIDECYN